MTNLQKTASGIVVALAVTLGAFNVASATLPQRAAPATKTKTINFHANYKGKITLLIKNSTVTASAVHGTGKATILGNSTLSGTGKSSTSAECDPMTGTGSLTGSGSKLVLKILSNSQGCGTYPAPTTVTVTGTAKVTSGVGQFKGATGTLSFSGSFTLPSSSKGSKDKFTASISGKLRVKS